MRGRRGAILSLMAAVSAGVPEPARGEEHNVALASEGAVAAADSEAPPAPKIPGGKARFLIDGTWIGPGDKPESNRWCSAAGRPHPHWVWVRFRGPARVSRVVVHGADAETYPVDLVAERSPDGGLTFEPLFEVKDNRMDGKTFALERSFPPATTDNVRLRILRSSGTASPDLAQLSELEVFGEFAAPAAGAASTPAPPELPAPVFAAGESAPPTGLDVAVRDDVIECRSPWLRIALDRRRPTVTALCWDSLGEGRVDENLLKPGPAGGGRLAVAPVFPDPAASPREAPAFLQGNVVTYTADLSADVRVRWEIRVLPKAVQMAVVASVAKGGAFRNPPGIRLAFAVDKTPVAPLAVPRPGAAAPLPCLLHAADYGSLLVRGPARGGLDGESVRPASQWNATLLADADRGEDGLARVRPGVSRSRFDLTVEGVTPLPDLAGADRRLRAFPRHWLNTFQYRPDIGILSNNIVSDNAVFCLFTFTDPAVFTPTLPGGIDAIQLARESLDRYFGGAEGYGVGSDVFLDSDPALIVSAWDVVRVTGDLDLLRRWLPSLEALAERTRRRDRDGNGLPESARSGNRGDALDPRFRTGNWWDCINFGHEDAYCCALDFRAFRHLADLERLAGRGEQAERCEKDAERIRKAYVPTFLNPATGVLAGWKSRDGALHDYDFLFVNGMAIVYGLVPTDLANEIVNRLEKRIAAAKYTRFDLGLPGNLIPIPKDDYIVGTPGASQKADGSDGFGVFENGGATACYAYFYIQALYQLGRRAEADRILWPMMETYAKGGFQNGVAHAGEWRRWDGTPSGYEGFLADAYYTQMAVFTGHYGIAFGPDGFRLEPWSPLKGKGARLGLKYMGQVVEEVR